MHGLATWHREAVGHAMPSIQQRSRICRLAGVGSWACLLYRNEHFFGECLASCGHSCTRSRQVRAPSPPGCLSDLDLIQGCHIFSFVLVLWCPIMLTVLMLASRARPSVIQHNAVIPSATSALVKLPQLPFQLDNMLMGSLVSGTAAWNTPDGGNHDWVEVTPYGCLREL